MKTVEPKVFLIGESKLDHAGLSAMLAAIGVPDWASDTENEAEIICEVAGKTCYMSFDVSLNQNLSVTGTRTNFAYLQEGLIATRHGSVLEHVTVTFEFIDVSRVLTHELVRHRAGAAYSQTSGRYVRTDELAFWIPTCIRNDPALLRVFMDEINHQEKALKKLHRLSGIDRMKGKAGFAKKKELTSAFRRVVGNGLATNIVVTYNHRALRHVIEMRTARDAEEEIRLVFNKVFQIMETRFPAIYDDASGVLVDGLFEIKFKTIKV